MIKSRKLPKKNIKHIAEEIKCNFRVFNVDETKPVRSQISIDTNTEKILKKSFDRSVDLYLYKEHYLLIRSYLSHYSISGMLKKLTRSMVIYL